MTDLQRALIAKRYGDTPHEVITVFPDGGELHRFKNRAGDDYYESNGWKVGRNPMKSWQATCRTWQRHELPRKEQDNQGPVSPEIDNIPF